MPDYIIQIIYLVSALFLILGLKRLSSPADSKSGLLIAGISILISVLVTFLHKEVNTNYLLMPIAMLIGGGIAFLMTKKAPLPRIPQMTALFNGMGGGAVAAIAAIELIKTGTMTDSAKYLCIFAAFLGSLSFTGSLIAYAKNKGILKDKIHLPMHQWLNAFIAVIALTFGVALVLNGSQLEVSWLIIFFVLSLVLGILITFAIGKADLPIASAVFNASTGLAIGFVGFVLSNPLLMLAGVLGGGIGLTLAKMLSKSKNRPILNVLFGYDGIPAITSEGINQKNKRIRELGANDAAMMMMFAKRIIVIPGYGMAKAKAQHKLWDLTKHLIDKGTDIKFAIHPVAGRMPGHMNVLLAETGIPYELIHDLDGINKDFANTDVVLIIGANDVTNPSANSDHNSPIYGMPILNADKAKNVIVVKRGKGTGYAKIDNPLFYKQNTGLIYGDAESVLNKLVDSLKSV